MTNLHEGPTLESFLKQEGIFDECVAQAEKELLAEQFQHEIAEKGISKTEMAAQMKTSRAVLNRLLDPHNPSVSLQTMQKAARVVGKRLEIRLV
jgi:DNA-binding Xre family transcriptional regulator